jgi:hypothetical protein
MCDSTFATDGCSTFFTGTESTEVSFTSPTVPSLEAPTLLTTPIIPMTENNPTAPMRMTFGRDTSIPRSKIEIKYNYQQR